MDDMDTNVITEGEEYVVRRRKRDNTAQPAAQSAAQSAEISAEQPDVPVPRRRSAVIPMPGMQQPQPSAQHRSNAQTEPENIDEHEPDEGEQLNRRLFGRGENTQGDAGEEVYDDVDYDQPEDAESKPRRGGIAAWFRSLKIVEVDENGNPLPKADTEPAKPTAKKKKSTAKKKSASRPKRKRDDMAETDYDEYDDGNAQSEYVDIVDETEAEPAYIDEYDAVEPEIPAEEFEEDYLEDFVPEDADTAEDKSYARSRVTDYGNYETAETDAYDVKAEIEPYTADQGQFEVENLEPDISIVSHADKADAVEGSETVAEIDVTPVSRRSRRNAQQSQPRKQSDGSGYDDGTLARRYINATLDGKRQILYDHWEEQFKLRMVVEPKPDCMQRISDMVRETLNLCPDETILNARWERIDELLNDRSSAVVAEYMYRNLLEQVRTEEQTGERRGVSEAQQPQPQTDGEAELTYNGDDAYIRRVNTEYDTQPQFDDQPDYIDDFDQNDQYGAPEEYDESAAVEADYELGEGEEPQPAPKRGLLKRILDIRGTYKSPDDYDAPQAAQDKKRGIIGKLFPRGEVLDYTDDEYQGDEPDDFAAPAEEPLDYTDSELDELTSIDEDYMPIRQDEATRPAQARYSRVYDGDTGRPDYEIDNTRPAQPYRSDGYGFNDDTENRFRVKRSNYDSTESW